ncbi:MAG: MBOAT family protein [Cyclobacteriaceae bacterium]
MLFNSIAFIVFATFFFAGYGILKRSSNGIIWLFLIAASFFFYGWWDWRFISLLVTSGLIDFASGLAIVKWKKFKKLFLVASISSNLLVLGAFKYAYFFCGGLEKLSAVVTGQTVDCDVPVFFSVLPIGISFYTFQSMSYTVDVYHDRLRPTRNVLHFFAFLSLFPQLVAGPIVRAANLLPQLQKPRPVSEIMRWHGLKLIAIGFFKKTVLADNIGPFVNNAFANEINNTSTPFWWLVMVAFGFQIYCDFSGYSDIARGLAKWMGIHFKVNFNHPYLSSSFRQFWRRWHISLSTWFRDYVYIPMGGSKKGNFRGAIALWITMLLSGFWHGAGVTFILWGAMHAFYLSAERAAKQIISLAIPKIVGILLTFFFATVAWVFFRSNSFEQSLTIFSHLFALNMQWDIGNCEVFDQGIWFVVWIALIEIFVLLFDNYFKRNVRPAWFRKVDVLVVSSILLASIFLRGSAAQFVYFQF